MDFLWQQFVFFLLGVPVSIYAQRITTEEVEDRALFEKDYKWQNVNVHPGLPVPQLIFNPFAVVGFKGDSLEKPNKPLTPRRETGRGDETNTLYCTSPAKLSDPDLDQASTQPSVKCGGTAESFYTPPSLIPPGVISVALNSPHIHTSENFPAIRSIPFLIQLKQQSVNNYSVANPTSGILENPSSQILSQVQSSAIRPGIYNSKNLCVQVKNEKHSNNILPTDTAFVERTNVYNASGTICPRCRFIVPPVKGCCLNPGQSIIVKKSKSKLRKFLPLILMAMLKDESDRPSCCCRCCNRQASGISMPSQ